MFRVTPETGTLVSVGSGYTGVREMTSMGGYLWTIKNSSLSRTDPMTGKSYVINPVNWSTLSQMTRITDGNFKNSLFIVEGDILYRVDIFGNRYKLSSGWSGAYQLTANDL